MILAFMIINGPLAWLCLNFSHQLGKAGVAIAIPGILFNALLSPFVWVIIVWELTRKIVPNWASQRFDPGVFAMFFALSTGPLLAYATYPTLIYLHYRGVELYVLAGGSESLFDFSTWYGDFLEFLLHNSPYAGKSY